MRLELGYCFQGLFILFIDILESVWSCCFGRHLTEVVTSAYKDQKDIIYAHKITATTAAVILSAMQQKSFFTYLPHIYMLVTIINLFLWMWITQDNFICHIYGAL